MDLVVPMFRQTHANVYDIIIYYTICMRCIHFIWHKVCVIVCVFVCFWSPHSKVVFGLTMGTCGLQMIRKSELLKKEQRLAESRIFFFLGMVTWSCRNKYDVVLWFFIYICWIDWEYIRLLDI